MAKIDVKVRSDVGDLGIHPKYGALVPGTTITIEEEEFGDGLFERPKKGWISPLEQQDKDERARRDKEAAAAETAPSAPATKEVIDNA